MKDLSTIPEEFHILFTSDWNKGNESKMSSTQRMYMGELYLNYNKWSIQQSIKPVVKQKEETITGFPKD
jgi:uncharacterized protein YecA (UPF0149 family)